LQIQVDQGIKTLAQAKKEVQRAIQHAVTKTIAAFLNSRGGTLLIGVDDAGTPVGIDDDFAYLKSGRQGADGWLLSLKDMIINALEPEALSAVRVSLVRHEGAMVAVAQCSPCRSETWHSDSKLQRFYVRASNATHELSGPSLTRYARERWPTD
jgi:predicted HTH transcriptional regulator